MKKLVITAEKGGVGKTTVSVQMAFYLALRLKKRVLFLDLDSQNNASKTISTQGVATIAPFNTFDIFTRDIEALPPSPFVLVPEGDRGTTTLEGRPSEHNEFVTRLLDFLDAVDEHFDVCIMDTGPRADFPHFVALIVADYFVAPLMLTQYALDGIALPVRWAMRTRLDSAAKIADYHGPLLQVHGDADTIVPLCFAQRLHAAANPPKKLIIYPGHDHNDPMPPEYYDELAAFWTACRINRRNSPSSHAPRGRTR